jgi:BirA family biotin operon repressor/biotin-[acetyl-CoA-carboxylase] ligase
MDPIVWRVSYFDEIDSTNTWLAQRARENAPEGEVAFAGFQSAGRGRLERVWEAVPGSSLLCSLLLRPPLSPQELQWAVACVALGARAALVRLSGVRPDLKWPNDLMVGEKKLAGLLAEFVPVSNQAAVVVGIGINLTDSGSHDPRATSVLDEAGVTVTPRALLDILLEEVERRRSLLEDEEGRDRLRSEYERALGTLGQIVRVQTHTETIVGEASRVDETGQLVLLVDGVERVFAAGDVVHARAEAQ